MDEVKRLIRQVDVVGSPDLWSDIETRRPRPPEPGPGPGRRVVVAVMALLLSAGGTWLLVRSFGATGSSLPPATRATPATPHLAAEIAMPDGLVPSSVDVGPDAAWVAAYPDGDGGGALLRVDLGTNQIVATIPLRQPTLVRAVGDTVWVAEPGLQVLRRVDATTNMVVASIHLPGNWLSSMAADEAGVWVLTFSGYGERGVSSATPRLVRIDPATNQIVADHRFGRFSMNDDQQLQIGAGSVWILGGPVAEGDDGGELLQIDPATARVVATVPFDCFGFSVGPRLVWVWVPADGVFDTEDEPMAVRRIDVDTFTISRPFVPLSGVPYNLLGADDGGVWLSAHEGRDARIRPVHIDANTLEVDMRAPAAGVWPGNAILDAPTRTIWISGEHAVDRIDY